MFDIRCYKNEYPDEGDIVLTRIIDMNDYCVKGVLVEYGNIDTMLQLSQASKRRVKSIRQIFKLNQIYPLEVFSVEQKGEHRYIDLSNKTLTDEQKNETIINTRRYQIALNLIKKFATKIKLETLEELTELCNKTIWKLDKEEVFNYIKECYSDISKLELFDLTVEEKKVLHTVLLTSLKNPLFKITAKIELSCYTFNGISSIKNVLVDTLKEVDKNITITFESGYEYLLNLTKDNIEDCKKTIYECINIIRNKIDKLYGSCWLRYVYITNNINTTDTEIIEENTKPDNYHFSSYYSHLLNT